MSRDLHILYCHCAFADLVSPDARDAVLRGLVEAGVEFEAVADLCELASRRDSSLKALVEHADLRIIACHPRAVRWLFEVAGAPLPGKGSEVLNLRADGAEKVLRAVVAETGTSGPEPDRTSAEALKADLEAAAARGGQWVPWFPVIDYDRCKNCKQCLNFCLFGTYALDDDGKVRVTSPDKCKTNCPACARVCPEVAIIFPKHPGGPIDGAEVTEEDLRREDVRIGLSAHSRGDIYAALRKRGRPGRTGGLDPK